MIIRLTKLAIIFSLLWVLGGECIAQCENHIEISAFKVNVADTSMVAMLDTMVFLVDKCGIDKSSVFFYICESNFDGGNHFFGKVLLYEASSYQEMWHNEELNKTDELFWKTYYFYHKEVLCVCHADHEDLFEDIAKFSNTLLLPINVPNKNPYYLYNVPQNLNHV